MMFDYVILSFSMQENNPLCFFLIEAVIEFTQLYAYAILIISILSKYF